MKKITQLFSALALMLAFTLQANAQCLEWNASGGNPWSNFAVAPCSGTITGGPTCDEPTTVGFGVWDSEAYFVEGFTPGAEYVFDFCSAGGSSAAYDETKWKATVTVVGYDGATGTVMEDQVISTSEGCSHTFTIPADFQPTTIVIIVNDVDDCGNNDEIENGSPTLKCGPNGGQAPCVAPECIEPGNMDLTLDNQILCPGGIITIKNDNTQEIPTGGGYGFNFINTATNEPYGICFGANGNVYEGDLNADLSAAGLPILQPGTYKVIGFAYATCGDPIACYTPDSLTLEVTADPNGCSSSCVSSGSIAEGSLVQTSCPGQEITLATDGTEEIPAIGDYAWIFADSATLQISGIWILGPEISFDPHDLKDENGDFLPAGTYLVIGATLPDVDGDLQPQTCWTPNFATIHILDENDPACSNISDCDAGMISAPLLSETQIVCDGSTVTFAATGAIVPSNAVYSWLLIPLDPDATANIFPFGSTATLDLNELLMDNGGDLLYGEYYAFGVIADTNDITNADTWCAITADSLFVTFYEEGAPECSVGINNLQNSNNLKVMNVMPVPTTNFVNINFDSAIAGNVSYVVYDATGKVIANNNNFDAKRGLNRLTIDANQYSSGIYFVKIHNGKYTTTARFIRQ